MADANNFKPVSPETVSAFNRMSHDIITETVNRSMQFPEEIQGHGDKAEHLITMGLEFTIKMLDPIMTTGNTDLMEDQLAWAMDRLPHDGVHAQHIINRYERLIVVIKEMMPDQQASEITLYIEYMINRTKELSAGN